MVHSTERAGDWLPLPVCAVESDGLFSSNPPLLCQSLYRFYSSNPHPSSLYPLFIFCCLAVSLFSLQPLILELSLYKTTSAVVVCSQIALQNKNKARNRVWICAVSSGAFWWCTEKFIVHLWIDYVVINFLSIWCIPFSYILCLPLVFWCLKGHHNPLFHHQ